MLANAAPEDVSYILRFVRDAGDKAIYRTKLGVSLALTEMLRRDKAPRDEIKLDPQDVTLLLDFAGSTDRTMRIYAGEFMFDLESPEVTRLALPRALRATNDDARYNWILVQKGESWLRMSDKQRAELNPVLEKLKVTSRSLPKTAKLLELFN